MNVLIDEYPLLVLPTLAEQYGLNESIVIQQIHYWSKRNKKSEDGYVWVYNTIPEWKKQFPFWSERTIFTILKKLRDSELLFAERKSDNPWNQTLYYRLNYEKFGYAISQPLQDRARKDCKITVNTETTRYINSFNEFWKAYPRKIAKGTAEKSWEKIKPDDQLLQEILAAVAKQKSTWIDPKFIPHPATWLNGKRWLDGIDSTDGKKLKYWEKGYQP